MLFSGESYTCILVKLCTLLERKIPHLSSIFLYCLITELSNEILK